MQPTCIDSLYQHFDENSYSQFDQNNNSINEISDIYSDEYEDELNAECNSKRKRFKYEELGIEATEENLLNLEFNNPNDSQNYLNYQYDVICNSNIQTVQVEDRVLIEKDIEEFIAFEYVNDFSSQAKVDSVQNQEPISTIFDDYRMNDKGTTCKLYNTNPGNDCFRDILQTHTPTCNSEYGKNNCSVLSDITNIPIEKHTLASNYAITDKPNTNSSILKRLLSSVFNADHQSKSLPSLVIKRSNSEDSDDNSGVNSNIAVHEVMKSEINDEENDKPEQSNILYTNLIPDQRQQHLVDFINIKSHQGGANSMTLPYSSDYWIQSQQNTQLPHQPITMTMNSSTLVNGNGTGSSNNSAHHNHSSVPPSPTQSNQMTSISETSTSSNLYQSKMSIASSSVSFAENSPYFSSFNQSTNNHSSELLAQTPNSHLHGATEPNHHQQGQNSHQDQHIPPLLTHQFNTRFIAPQRFGAPPNAFISGNMFSFDPNNNITNVGAHASVSGHTSLPPDPFLGNDTRECVNCGKSQLLSPTSSITAKFSSHNI